MTLEKIINKIRIKLLHFSNQEKRMKYWRNRGMKIGDNCRFESMNFSTEPYLIEIGDHVAIAYGTIFITHDGGTWCFQDEMADADLFGKIIIGNNVHIGHNCVILPNASIGNNCMIGAGSVIRGKIPDNSVVMGNPATVLTNMNVQKFLYKQNPGLMRTVNLSDAQKEHLVKKHFGIE